MRQLRSVTGIGALSPRSGPEIWDRLARTTGLDEETLSILRWRDAPHGSDRWVVVGGEPFRLQDLEMAAFRHGPLCLAQDEFVSARWSIRLAVACDRHRTRLTETCSGCGRHALLDDRAQPFGCGVCGLPFAEGSAVRASSGEIGLSRMVADPGGSGRLSRTLRGLSPGGMCATLGKALDCLDMLDARPIGPGALADDARRAAAAHRLAISWDREAASLACRMAANPAARGTRLGVAALFDTAAGRLAVEPLRGGDGRLLDALSSALAQYAAEEGGTRFRARAPGSSRIHGGSTPAASTPISHAEAMQRLEGSDEGGKARWWIEAGILRETIGASRRATLSLADVTRAERRLATLAPAPAIADPCGIDHVDRTIAACRRYGKAAFLRQLLDGLVPFERRNSGSGISSMVFDRAAIERLRALEHMRWWRARDHYASLSAFNAVAAAAWGVSARLTMGECDALAASGRTRLRTYHPPTPGARPQK